MNLTRSAAQLGYSKAFISKKLKLLEEALNVKLIERSTRNMQLTEMGKELYLDISPAMEKIVLTLERIESREQKPQGRLNLSAPVEFGQFLSQKLLGDFSQLYPEIIVDLDLTPQKKELLAENLDLIIRVGEVQDSSYIYRKIFDAQMGIYCAPQYLHRLKNIGDLKALNWVSSGNENALLGKDHPVLQELGTTVIVSRNLTSRMHLIANGMGLGLLPAFIFEEEIAKGKIVPVFPEIVSIPIPFGFIYASQKYTPLKIKLFVDFVLSRLRK